MSSSTPTILVVAGATGNLGRLICAAALARARATGRPLLVRGLVRRGGMPRNAPPADPSDEQRLVYEEVDYNNPAELRRVCAGAGCVISTLQGLEGVIVTVQSRLLEAALDCGVPRFIPSDFSGDFRRLPRGANRNFDLRRSFHDVAAARIDARQASLQLTSIYQGGFTELLASGWVLFDYKKRQVNYFGEPDRPMEYTTWADTADYTAAVALDPNPTPRSLFIAGCRLSPRDGQALAERLTGATFKLNRVMPVWLLGLVIRLLRFVKPGGKDEVMPLWVAMQYGYAGALGVMTPPHLDNDRYPGITWTGPDAIIREAFSLAQAAGQGKGATIG